MVLIAFYKSSLFLLGQHMDDGVHCLVVEVGTNANDESLDVAYACIRSA